MAQKLAWKIWSQIGCSDGSTSEKISKNLSAEKTYFFLKFPRYYVPLVIFCSFGIPILLSTYVFGEALMVAYHINVFRYILTLHITWSINSVSHIWGSKPFEKDMAPTDTYIIGFLAFGEGWHNYHHVYPWDYKVSELPRYWCNFSIPFLDFFAWLGWATDLKTGNEKHFATLSDYLIIVCF